jgi:hypothetical protein
MIKLKFSLVQTLNDDSANQIVKFKNGNVIDFVFYNILSIEVY